MTAIGDAIGSYRIVSKIGEGGMGEVYRAHDTKLGRDVAIKVLPEALAQDPDRRARFEREARLLAALHHPHIATIFGVEDVDGTLAIVMELVDGQTLAERIEGLRAKGSALPLKDALAIARQFADALDAAHEKGIVHRDLKPANITVTRDGSVKVLDFGLATAVAGAGGEQSTIATRLVSQAGSIVGTAAYMSPEQARGQAVDKRTDIWAFGCVLYEMLAGTPAFAGATASDVLARILERDPSWDVLPATTPPGVRRLLERCLDKDQKRRLRDIGDAGRELDELIAAPGPSSDAPPRRSSARVWAGALVLVVVTAAATGVVVRRFAPRPASAPAPVPVARLVVTPDEPLAVNSDGGGVAISPDGQRLAFVAGKEVRRLYVREIDQYDAKVLPGTDGADGPGFSPDGTRLAFVAGGQLKTVALAGGSPQVLCDVTESYGLDWAADDAIYFSRARGSGIWRIPASGGRPTEFTKLGPRDDQHRYPHVLPGGKAVLFSTLSSAFDQQIFVQSLQTGERRPLASGAAPRYVASGHVVFVRGGTMYAMPFDPVRLETSGAPAVVFPGIREIGFGRPYISFSDSGTLAYVAAASDEQDALVWVDRRGTEQTTGLSGRRYQAPRLSPNGRLVAIGLPSGTASSSASDVWLYDLTRATLSRLTFDGANSMPIWSPDGSRVAFSAVGGNPAAIRSRTFDGSGPEEEILSDAARVNRPLSWSPDGTTLAMVRANPSTANDIWVMDVRSHGAPRPFVNTPFREGSPTFSHDGRFIAYVSDKSGRNEIYMRPYPGPGGEITISTEGGNEPVWARRTGQLFYRQGTTMMAVDIVTQPSVSAGKPYSLFGNAYNLTTALWPNYDVTPDGQRFLMVKSLSRNTPPQINIVLNWIDELNQLSPAKSAK